MPDVMNTTTASTNTIGPVRWSIAICAPDPDSWRLRMLACSTCGKRRKMLVTHYEWYGSYVTCLTCGERWADGERMARPFSPGWRKKNVERARKFIASRRPDA